VSKLRAIDLYAGVGGWSFGLEMAGIEVVAAYEWWEPATETYAKNNAHLPTLADIRKLDLSKLPMGIDVVVGSPPCTQFSFANRGGRGDIDDGLKDIEKFLEIVDYVRPAHWAMENVPRVAGILTRELQSGGRLARFAHLCTTVKVVNMAEFGLPQQRRRCLAGNFDFNALLSQRTQSSLTLGEVIEALSADPIQDPLYGVTVGSVDVRDHVLEEPLDPEEVRINRAAKINHPIYNAMAFPDRLDRPSRTITATCTRVSRESIVVPGVHGVRRLTLRERATLQGFPITYQFLGRSYGQRLKMIGNAVPPIFSVAVAKAFFQERGNPLNIALKVQRPTTGHADSALPDKRSKKYPADRRFRFAIPSLQLKSGVRFELSNCAHTGELLWRVAFFYGNSKNIQTLLLDMKLVMSVREQLPRAAQTAVSDTLANLEEYLMKVDLQNLQKVWSHRGPGQTRPLMLLDTLDIYGDKLASILVQSATPATTLETVLRRQGSQPRGLPKLLKHAPTILAGLLVGGTVNHVFGKHGEDRQLPVALRA